MVEKDGVRERNALAAREDADATGVVHAQLEPALSVFAAPPLPQLLSLHTLGLRLWWWCPKEDADALRLLLAAVGRMSVLEDESRRSSRTTSDVLSPLLASLGVRSRCVRQRPNVHPLSVLALHSCPLLSPVGFIGWW